MPEGNFLGSTTRFPFEKKDNQYDYCFVDLANLFVATLDKTVVEVHIDVAKVPQTG